MSKQSQRKQEAIQKSIANIPDKEPSHYDKKLMEEERRKDNARPSLIKRIGVGLLDFLFAAVLAGGLFAVTYFTIFPSLGYNEAAAKIVDAYNSSHLYNTLDGSFVLISDSYDTTKTPEENYDIPITAYYSEDERAVKDNKLDKYNETKLNSGYYELDGDNIVRKADVSGDTAKAFLEQQYNSALDFLFEDPLIIESYYTTFNCMAFSILIIVIISSSVFYIAIPLIDKRHRTLGYMIGKLIPVNSKEMGPVYWDRILLRNAIFVVFTFISPITLYFWANAITFSFIPFFVNSAVLLFTRSNSGIHDFAGRVNIVNQSLSNPFENLKAITEQGENNNEHIINQ